MAIRIGLVGVIFILSLSCSNSKKQNGTDVDIGVDDDGDTSAKSTAHEENENTGESSEDINNDSSSASQEEADEQNDSPDSDGNSKDDNSTAESTDDPNDMPSDGQNEESSGGESDDNPENGPNDSAENETDIDNTGDEKDTETKDKDTSDSSEEEDSEPSNEENTDNAAETDTSDIISSTEDITGTDTETDEVVIGADLSCEARTLLQYLYDITGNYILSGQTSAHYDGGAETAVFPSTRDQYFYDQVGQYPAIHASNFGDVTYENLEDRQIIVDNAILYWEQGSIIQISYAINQPDERDGASLYTIRVEEEYPDENIVQILTEGSEFNMIHMSRLEELADYLEQLTDHRLKAKGSGAPQGA